ncbi:uncharacterized protein [Rutidosis leptorrhynchoides]|uniref:uncharacterized protein n=1 Tax=Rutidosis leptorrhynchoides TaxID=125765 RepID=UPI003A99BF96
MSGTPNKRVHDDSGGNSSVARCSHTQDDSGSYSSMGPTNPKLANPSAPSDYHAASLDTGHDARLPKVPRTETNLRRSPLLPMYRMQSSSSLNDSQSDHAVKLEERFDSRDNVNNNVRDSKAENRDVKAQSKELFQGARSDKDVRYTSDGHKETKYEVKTEKEAYKSMKESKDHYKSGGNLEQQWHTSRSSNVHGQMNYTEAREAVSENKADVKDMDIKRKDGKHQEWGDNNKDRNECQSNIYNEMKDPTKEKEIDRKHLQKENEKVRDKEKDADVLSSSSKAMDQKNQKVTDGETNDKTLEKNVEIEGEKRNKGFEKDLDNVEGSTDTERNSFNYGVQQRKLMLRHRGSPQIGNRSNGCNNIMNTGKGDVSAVLYRVGECMQELIKLWKEYEKSEKLKTSETSITGPTLDIRIPAEHVCATNRQVKGGQLWGTDIYTNDSDLVAVLMHTGYCRPTASPPPPAVQELRATVRVLPPQNCYGSTLRNNVRSRAWGAAIGCSYRVERCYIVKKGGGTIDLEPCLTHTSTVEPTLAPVVVERTMTTRAAASNALRQQRFVREVTLQYNLCNEPWIKYSISAIADKGLKKPLFTSARLKKGEVLYLESHERRYELCFNGEKMVKATSNEAETNAVDSDNNNSNSNSNSNMMDVFRWSVCKKPLPQTIMSSIGIPMPPEHLQVLEENLNWEDIQWSQTGVWISGKEYLLSRLHFLSPPI